MYICIYIYINISVNLFVLNQKSSSNDSTFYILYKLDCKIQISLARRDLTIP